MSIRVRERTVGNDRSLTRSNVIRPPSFKGLSTQWSHLHRSSFLIQSLLLIDACAGTDPWCPAVRSGLGSASDHIGQVE
jgi:hypothetical protein